MFADHGFYCKRRLLGLVICWLVVVTLAFAEPLELSPENELLLELRLDGMALGQDILGYQRGEEFLLSLDELSSALGFSINVNTVDGTASGWFISEDRVFSLDLAGADVVSAEKSWSLVDGEAVLFQGELYVESTAIQKWFPLTLDAVVRELYLDIKPTEVLPIQQRMNRRARLASSGTSNYQDIQHPLQENPYQLVGPHTTNLRLGYSTARESFKSDAQYNASYATLSRGDLGWMTSTLALAGGADESLTAARLKLERTAFNGPLGLDHIEVGDVDAGFRGALIRGTSANNADAGRPDTEVVTLEGSQLPDWDVELYQNSQLVSIQTIGDDGQYLFEDIDLVFGENRFELQFFGPNGEIESREEFHYLGPDILSRGDVSYEFSALQNGQTVFGINDSAESVDTGSGVYASSVNMGLSSNLSIGANVSSRESNGERLDSGSIRLGFSLSRLYGSLRYATSSQGQSSAETSLRTRFGNTNINLGFTQFFNELELVTEEAEIETSSQYWNSSVDVSSSILTIPFKLNASIQERENATFREVNLGTTLPLWGAGYLSTALWHTANEERLDGFILTSSAAGGQASFNTTIRPWTIRFAATYGLLPETELRQLTANGNLRIDSNMNLNLGVRQSGTTDTVTYNAGINWLLDKFAIGTNVSFNSDERWAGSISLGTTVVQKRDSLWPNLDRKASVNTGRVEARVYEDVNGAERQPYAGAVVNSVQIWRKATTDAKGIASLSSVPTYKQVDIELDEFTLEDYELRSTNPGVSIITRPGSYAIVDFPLVRSAELEGYIYKSEAGGDVPVSRALVFLKSLDGEVVSQTRTAFDGFYLFEGVVPGDYQISLESPMEQRVMKRPVQVAVNSDSGVIAGLDYRLRPDESNTQGRTLLAQGSEQQDADNPSTTSAMPTLSAALPEPETVVSPPQPPQPQTGNGDWFVQIGAYDSRAVAQASWERLSDAIRVLQGKTARFMAYQSMTRLLVGPGSPRDVANTLCQRLKAESMDCMVRRVD